jgi:hypothetical protein
MSSAERVSGCLVKPATVRRTALYATVQGNLEVFVAFVAFVVKL